MNPDNLAADVGQRAVPLGPAVAHPARVYNVWLGGKDHFAPDREAAQRVAGCRPQVVAGARANRQFLGRVVRYLAGTRGVSQFLDIGTGLPAPDNTHELAQALNPAARVVYADNDPVVLAHARALLTSRPGGTCDYLDADLHDPAGILAGAARTLDLGRPAAVLLLAVLHFLPDADDPAGILAALAAGLAPGSFVALSHVTGDFAPAAVASGVAAYNEAVPTGITARSHAEVTALLGGLSLVPPGVVPVSEWRPEPGTVRQPADLYAGLAATRTSPHQSRLRPAPGHASGPITEPSGPPSAMAGDPPRLPPAGPGPAGDTGPDLDPEESLQRMLVLTGLLSAAGLTASLNVTRDIPDVTARLPQPGGRDITVIVDDDGYIELRFWARPGTSPSHITTMLTGAIRVITAQTGT
ncbi:MAG TPA: SAM-dependent methyltransferase [Streptosporangiaceae bacterium]